MVKQAAGSGVPVLVLDPSGARWDADFVTQDIDEYIRVVFANSRCLLIIDEAGEAVGRAMSTDHAPRLKLATRTRHRGHNAIFISQAASTVSPVIRRQCQRLWAFRQSFNSCKVLSEEMCNPGVMAAAQLSKGHCLYADLYGEVSEFCVFDMDKSGTFSHHSRKADYALTTADKSADQEE